MENKIRLNKFLSERLGVSRREADELISAGRVTVDGNIAILGTKIDSSSKIFCNNKIVPFETEYKYVAFHKPVGYVCSRRAQGSAPTLYDLLPKEFQKLKTVGRLDKDSSGLILLTNDGDFAFQMTHPKFRKTKVYEVELDRPLEPLHQQIISDYGVMLDDGPSQFKIVKKEPELPLSRGIRGASVGELARSPRGGLSKESSKERTSSFFRDDDRLATLVDGRERRDPREMVVPVLYNVILAEGRNRQIRRTFASLGYKVIKLHRTQFGKYELGKLKPGEYVIIES
ncbi:rRNA pseudouridine synthase [Candidatus Saccharibacteria bacterium]|nr:rRNA pseudouridine synthase [Candidatus Saccharibacteria bacterium]